MDLTQLIAALSIFTCVIVSANVYFILKTKRRSDAWEELARVLLEQARSSRVGYYKALYKE
jgi:hypothetical protein